MAELSYVVEYGVGGTAQFESGSVFIKAGGPDAGTVWVRNSQNGTLTPASANQVAACQAGITGFSAALTACEAIED